MMVCMLGSVSAMASEAAPESATESVETAQTELNFDEKVITWDATMEAAAMATGFSGKFYTIDGLNMQLLIPDGLEQRQPTEEEKGKGDILIFENADQSEKVEFVLGPVADCKDLAQVKAFIEQNYPGITVNPMKINGYNTLVFGNEQTDSMTVLIGAGEDGFLRIICRPVTAPEMNERYAIVSESIQPIQ